MQPSNSGQKEWCTGRLGWGLNRLTSSLQHSSNRVEGTTHQKLTWAMTQTPNIVVNHTVAGILVRCRQLLICTSPSASRYTRLGHELHPTAGLKSISGLSTAEGFETLHTVHSKCTYKHAVKRSLKEVTDLDCIEVHQALPLAAWQEGQRDQLRLQWLRSTRGLLAIVRECNISAAILLSCLLSWVWSVVIAI